MADYPGLPNWNYGAQIPAEMIAQLLPFMPQHKEAQQMQQLRGAQINELEQMLPLKKEEASTNIGLNRARQGREVQGQQFDREEHPEKMLGLASARGLTDAQTRKTTADIQTPEERAAGLALTQEQANRYKSMSTAELDNELAQIFNTLMPDDPFRAQIQTYFQSKIAGGVPAAAPGGAKTRSPQAQAMYDHLMSLGGVGGATTPGAPGTDVTSMWKEYPETLLDNLMARTIPGYKKHVKPYMPEVKKRVGAAASKVGQGVKNVFWPAPNWEE